MDFLSPQCAQELIGHAKEFSMFEQSFQKGTLPHAWLISGLPGIGKETFAFQCVRRLLEIQPDSPAEKRFFAGTHEGIKVIRRESENEKGVKRRDISVEDIRKLIHFFQSAGEKRTWRVAIIDGAENLSLSASNALLKLLEEPPPQSIFFLITSRLGAIAETLRSRCVMVKLSPLSEAEMRRLFPENSEKILKYAKGSPQMAHLLLQKEYAVLLDEVDFLLSGKNVKEKAGEISGLLKKEDEIALFFTLLKEGIAFKSREKAQYNEFEKAQKWAERYFQLQKLLFDAERLSLEKGQVLIESLELLK